MQFTTVPETAKVIKFHAAATGAAVYSAADLAPRSSPLRGISDRNESMSLRGCGGQMDCAMQDLKAFERRLTEVIACARPGAIRWRIILGIITICTSVGMWQWMNDPMIYKVSFVDSVLLHPFFMLSSLILILLFLFGVHSRVMAHTIIATRTRSVLEDFNMSCDDNGKLILRPTAVAT